MSSAFRRGPCIAPGTEDTLAWLYVDGHVRVYSGSKKLPSTHVTRLRIVMPTVEDIWVHDAVGAPVLFVTQEAHPGLVSAIAPHWKREEEEGRTLVAAVLRSRGSIAVKDGKLRVTLAAQSTPKRTRLVETLCAILDETKTVFPGTKLVMRFAVDPSTQWGEARRVRPSRP